MLLACLVPPFPKRLTTRPAPGLLSPCLPNVWALEQVYDRHTVLLFGQRAVLGVGLALGGAVDVCMC